MPVKDTKTTEEAPPSAAATTATDTEKITVKSTLKAKPDGGDPVALWEKDPAHPNGEAFVAGSAPVEVGKTAEVARLLANKTLEEVK